jgi:hypothetical protein
MASKLIQGADAIVAEIAAQAAAENLNQTVQAARKLLAKYDLEEMATDKEARFTVVPTGKAIKRDSSGKRTGTRSRVGARFCFDVAVHRYVETDAQRESMFELMEQIEALFTDKRLPGFEEMSWEDSEYKAVFSVKALDEKKVFLAVTQIKFAGSL